MAGHDTASAVAAVPADGRFAFLSSGTWSLLGTELERPIVDERALAWNFTNEVGIGGTYRLLRNITGLWLVEGCRRAWERQGRWPGYEAIGGGDARRARVPGHDRSQRPVVPEPGRHAGRDCRLLPRDGSDAPANQPEA